MSESRHHPLVSKGHHLIVVDDDTEDCALLAKAIQRHDPRHQVAFVADGDALLTRLEEGPLPFLIVLDWHLPNEDGADILWRLKSHVRFRRIPVVIFTSSADPDDLGEAYDCGANAYMIKPSSFEGLLKAAHCLLEYWLVINQRPPFPA